PSRAIGSFPRPPGSLTHGAGSGASDIAARTSRNGSTGRLQSSNMPAARLILEDGTVYEGESFGSTENAIGEVVFNTSLTGYQEIATDPSYRFQIVTMTYPHIGNYGVESYVEQSSEPQVAGFVVRDVIEEPSSAHAQMSLSEYFSWHRLSASQGLNTRALTRKISTEGAMRGMISSQSNRDADSFVAERMTAPSNS